MLKVPNSDLVPNYLEKKAIKLSQPRSQQMTEQFWTFDNGIASRDPLQRRCDREFMLSELHNNNLLRGK